MADDYERFATNWEPSNPNVPEAFKNMTAAEAYDAFPRFWCLRCGERWQVPITMADDRGLIRGPISTDCPCCGHPVKSMPPRRERIEIRIAQELRQADLSMGELEGVRVVIERAPVDISPRALADRLPKRMSKVVTEASRVGKKWLPTLLTVVTATTAVMGLKVSADALRTSQESVQVSRDAETSRHADAQAALAAQRTGTLTDAQITEIARRVRAAMAVEPVVADADGETNESEAEAERGTLGNAPIVPAGDDRKDVDGEDHPGRSAKRERK